MKSQFIVRTVIQWKHSEKSQESAKGQSQRSAKGRDTDNRKTFCGITSFLSSCRRRGNQMSLSIEQVSIKLRVFCLWKRRGGRKRQGEYCNFPRTTQSARTWSIFLASLGVILWPPGWICGWHISSVSQQFWPVQSVLRWVGGKSLCSMKLQRAGDIFSKKEF